MGLGGDLIVDNQKNMYSQAIGLRAQNLLTILSLIIININGTYVTN